MKQIIFTVYESHPVNKLARFTSILELIVNGGVTKGILHQKLIEIPGTSLKELAVLTFPLSVTVPGTLLALERIPASRYKVKVCNLALQIPGIK